MFDGSLLFSFLDDWLSNESITTKEKSRLDQTLLAYLSNLAALHELLAAVRQFRPVCTPIGFDEAKSRGTERSAWRRLNDTDQIFEDEAKDTKIMAKLFEAVQTPFPSGKRDAAWLDRADEVRQNLKTYWAHARMMHAKELKSYPLCTKEDIGREISALSFGENSDYLAVLEEERKAILSSLEASRIAKTETVAGGTFTEAETTKSFELPLQPKTKTKSRPEVSPNVQTEIGKEEQIGIDEEAEHSPVPTLTVKSESLRVFLRMFPSTLEEHSAKPLDWKSFVRAMEDVGFPAEQSGGSAVTFAKDGLGRIVFHKPHPVAKIEQTILQSWGKRLGKWFSWRRETFVAAK